MNAILPPWYKWALGEIGQHELPDNRGPVIRRYISLAKCGAEGEPWCAIFANAAFEQCGLAGTRSPSSQSFRTSPHFVRLDGPALGAVVVYWRGSSTSGLGHVGFYKSESAGYIETVGGNEQDAVRSEMLVKHGAKFGLVGFYWHAAFPLPQIGAIASGAELHAIPGGKVT